MLAAPANATNGTQNRIRQSFARGLPSYHRAATAQARIAALLVDDLAAAGAPVQFRAALEFGCGTGHLTSQILQRLAVDHLMLNDLVAESTTALTPILRAHKTQTTFVAGAVETLDLPSQLDLITSASTVQWVADPAALITTLARHLAPGGWLAISGFGRSHFAELRAVGGAAQAPSYLDPNDWRAILPDTLHLHGVTARSITLQFPTALSLLHHLRQTGVNAGRHRHWTKRNLRDFDAGLRASQPGGASLKLSYNPVTVIAQNKP